MTGITKSFMHILVVVLAAMGVSSLVEVYKKTIRKGKAKAWENWLVATLLSAALAFGLEVTGFISPAITKFFIKMPEWSDIVVYGIFILLGQFEFGMRIIKEVLRWTADISPISSELRSLIDDFNTDDCNFETLIKILIKLGITLESAQIILSQAAAPPEEQEKLIAMYNAEKSH